MFTIGPRLPLLRMLPLLHTTKKHPQSGCFLMRMFLYFKINGRGILRMPLAAQQKMRQASAMVMRKASAARTTAGITK